APFYKIGIDIVGKLPVTPKGNKYIVVTTGYMTKWPEARAIKNANAQERNTFFNNLMDEFLKKFTITHHYSTRYHSQTNGLVEHFNKTLCESISKLVTNVREWDPLIPSVLFTYQTAKQSTTKIPLFFLVYGREARFPIHPDKNKELLEVTFLQRLFELTEVLPTVRNNAVRRVEKAQE
ncbi:4004_t:CDS:2, partial [Gigaspora rosea]